MIIGYDLIVATAANRVENLCREAHHVRQARRPPASSGPLGRRLLAALRVEPTAPSFLPMLDGYPSRRP